MRGAFLVAGLLAIAGCAGNLAEGRPWVHSFTIGGVHHVDAGDLIGKLAVEKTSWVPFAPKHYLDTFALQLDRKRIESYYHAHGFFRARVVSVDVKPRTPKSVDVRIVVDEGPVTKIAGVQLSGLEALPGEHLISMTPAGGLLKAGDAFDSAKLDVWTEHLTDELKSRGYAFSTVESAAQVDRDASVANVVVKVTPGQKTYIGAVRYTGDFSLVTPAQLQIHSGLVPGMLLTPDALEGARGKLYTLGIFASVKANYAHSANQAEHPELADVTLDVHEGPLRELRLGVGVGIEFQRNEVRLRAIYTRHNFLGGLRTLRLTLEPAYVAIPAVWDIQRSGPAGKAEAQFTQPDFLLPLVELKATASYNLGIDYAYQYHGPRAQLALSRPFLHDRLQVGISYNFEFLLFFNTDPAILADPQQARRLFGYTDPYRLGWFQQNVSLDLRDRPLDARKGAYLALNAEEGGAYAGGAFQYEKLLPEIRGYVPLGSRVVLAARVQFGQMFVQGALGSPITRRFYLGGPDSHRGFSYNRLSPQVPSGLPGTLSIPTGGDQMLLAQIEARVHMFKIAGFWLEAAAFLDAGDVAGPTCASSTGVATVCSAIAGMVSDRINLRDLHYAAGAGLRFKTVVGTIRADVGFRLNRLSPMESDGTPNPDPNSRVALHLSIGEPF